MVFSSLPSYLDPHNWPQQQPAGSIDVGGRDLSSQLQPPPPPLGSGGDGRSMQMSDRGRMGKPAAETAMKCPRCESTNTKFCYFNNYSLSQPRHFCKTCRRYWTRGGALRNVPVGGGCRRNKKSSSKGSRSKSPADAATTSSTNSINTNNTCISPRPSQFPILPPLHHYDVGLTFGSDFMNLGHDSDNYPSTKFAHFPFMEATNPGMYGEAGPSNYMKMKANHHHQQQHHQELNLSRNFPGISGNEQFLGTSNIAWGTTDVNAFSSSSTTTTTTTTTHLL